jgi:3-oxoacyl-[acyl-carrier protein] reductase
MGRLSGKRMVITGSSRGLGRAFALAAADAGAAVVINGTNEEALGAVAEELSARGAAFSVVSGSVADDAVCARLVETCVADHGGIDVLVHNAGIVRDRTLLKMTVEEWDEVIAVHLRGAFSLTRHGAAAMKAQGTGGHIVQIISASGLAGGFGQGNYAAAKAGMMGLLRTSVLELSRAGIRMNAMWPVAETDMTQVVFDRAAAAAADEGAQAPHPVDLGFGTPEEVAAGLIWLASDAAADLNGQCLSFNGRRAAFWSHPDECYVQFSDAPMTVEDLDAWAANTSPQTIHRPVLAR